MATSFSRCSSFSVRPFPITNPARSSTPSSAKHNPQRMVSRSVGPSSAIAQDLKGRGCQGRVLYSRRTRVGGEWRFWCVSVDIAQGLYSVNVPAFAANVDRKNDKPHSQLFSFLLRVIRATSRGGELYTQRGVVDAGYIPSFLRHGEFSSRKSCITRPLSFMRLLCRDLFARFRSDFVPPKPLAFPRRTAPSIILRATPSMQTPVCVVDVALVKTRNRIVRSENALEAHHGNRGSVAR